MYKSAKGPGSKKVRIKRDEKYYQSRYEKACCGAGSQHSNVIEVGWVDCEGNSKVVQCFDEHNARARTNQTTDETESCEEATQNYLQFLKTDIKNKKRRVKVRNNRVVKRSKKSKSNVRKISKKNKKKRSNRKARKQVFIENKEIESLALKKLRCEGRPSVVQPNVELPPLENNIRTTEALLPCAQVFAMKRYYDNQCAGVINPSVWRQLGIDFTEKNGGCYLGFCLGPDILLKYYEPKLDYSAIPYTNPLDKPNDFGSIDLHEFIPEEFSDNEDYYKKPPRVRLEIPESYIRHVFFNYGLKAHVDDFVEDMRNTVSESLSESEYLNEEDIQQFQEYVRHSTSDTGLPILEVNPIKPVSRALVHAINSSASFSWSTDQDPDEEYYFGRDSVLVTNGPEYEALKVKLENLKCLECHQDQHPKFKGSEKELINSFKSLKYSFYNPGNRCPIDDGKTSRNGITAVIQEKFKNITEHQEFYSDQNLWLLEGVDPIEEEPSIEHFWMVYNRILFPYSHINTLGLNTYLEDWDNAVEDRNYIMCGGPTNNMRTTVKILDWDTSTLYDSRDSGSNDPFYDGLNLKKIRITQDIHLLPDVMATWTAEDPEDWIRIKPVNGRATKIDLSSYPNHFKILPIDSPNAFNKNIPNNQGIEKSFRAIGNDDLVSLRGIFNLNFKYCNALKNSFKLRKESINNKSEYRKIISSNAQDEYDSTTPPFYCECFSDNSNYSSWCLFDETKQDKFIQINRIESEIHHRTIKNEDNHVVNLYYSAKNIVKEALRLPVFWDVNDAKVLNYIEFQRSNNNDIKKDNNLLPYYRFEETLNKDLDNEESGLPYIESFSFDHNYIYDLSDTNSRTEFFSLDSPVTREFLLSIKNDPILGPLVGNDIDSILSSHQWSNDPLTGLRVFTGNFFVVKDIFEQKALELINAFYFDHDLWQTHVSQLTNIDSDGTREFKNMLSELPSNLFVRGETGDSQSYLNIDFLNNLFTDLNRQNYQSGKLSRGFINFYNYALNEYKSIIPGKSLGKNFTYGKVFVDLLMGYTSSTNPSIQADISSTERQFAIFVAPLIALKIDHDQYMSEKRDAFPLPFILSRNDDNLDENFLPGATRRQERPFDFLFIPDDINFSEFPFYRIFVDNNYLLPAPPARYPLRAIGSKVSCVPKENSEELKFIVENDRVFDLDQMENYLNGINPASDIRLFSSTSLSKFKETVDNVCGGFRSEIKKLPESQAAEFVRNIPLKNGENRSTYHNSVGTEVTTNVDGGRYGLIFGGDGNTQVGEWKIEYVFMHEFWETIMDILEVPVIGWIIGAILVVVYFILYIVVTCFTAAFFALVVSFELAYNYSENDQFESRVFQEYMAARDLMIDMEKLTTTYDFNKVNLSINNLVSLNTSDVDNPSIIAGVRRYRVNKSELIVGKRGFTFLNPSLSDVRLENRTSMESNDSSRSPSSDIDTPSISADSFNTANDYNFHVFKTMVGGITHELIQGRTSPIATAAGSMNKYFESDLYLKTIVDSLNETINSHVLGLKTPDLNTEVSGVSPDDPFVFTENLSNERMVLALGRHCGTTLPRSHYLCTVNQILTSIESTFETNNKLCFSRVGAKTHYASLKDISFDANYLNDDSPPQRFCSGNEVYTEFEEQLFARDNELGVDRSDIVLRSFNEIKLQFERGNYSDSAVLEELRQSADPLRRNSPKYPWQMQCALFTDFTLKGTSRLEFNTDLVFPSDGSVGVPGLPVDEDVKLDISLDVFPHLTTNTIEKINNVYLCKHPDLCSFNNDQESNSVNDNLIPEVDSENFQIDSTQDTIMINGVRAKTMTGRAKDAQCAVMTDLWLRINLEGEDGGSSFDVTRYCNFSSLFLTGPSGRGDPNCNIRTGLIAPVLRSCQAARSIFLSLGDEGEAGASFAQECIAQINDEELNDIIDRIERVVNECRSSIPNYNGTFETKQELIKEMDIEERREDVSCDT